VKWRDVKDKKMQLKNFWQD